MDSQAEEHAAASLFFRARAGEREAFGQLFESHRHRLEALVYLSLGPRLRTRVDYEDVVQETFIKSFELQGTIEWQGSKCFFRWLARIAGHIVQNEARRNRDAAREVPLDAGAPGDGAPAGEANGAVQPEVSPLKMLRRNERFDRLEAALNGLLPDHREALVCAHIHGLPTREIARRLGRSPGAVGILLHRAKADLRRRFGDTDSLHLPARALAGLPADPAPDPSPGPPGPGEEVAAPAEGRRRGWRSR